LKKNHTTKLKCLDVVKKTHKVFLGTNLYD